MIATGIVVEVIAGRNHTVVRHSRCRVEVKWFKNVLPPKVKIGARITVLGKVMTFSNGRSFQLTDSVLLTKRPRAIQAALAELLEGLVVDPQTYLSMMDEYDHELRSTQLELPQPKVSP
jgi:hypothetical protein